jgi:DNA repair exonuclease SbcCD ATPase subunit
MSKLSSIKDKIKELDEAIKELEEKQEAARQIQNQADIHALSVTKLNVSLNEKEGLIRSNEQYIQKLEDLVDEIQKQTTEIDSEIRKADVFTKELDSINVDREDILKRAKIIGTLSELLKDSGIKTKIIRHYLPTMNRLINKYLSDMDFFVNFTIDENFNEVIKSRYRDEFNYDNFSEGEKFRIDISLLLTWREIAKRKNSVSTNLLILDEVFDSSLDTAGTDVFMKLLKSLGNKSNVFVISHRTDTIVDKFSSVIRFEKKNNFSRIAKD